MIRKCKWCGKEQEMQGKREFCPGEKCKNAWKYAKRTGKLEKKNISDEIPDENNTVHTLLGQLTKVTTTADQCLRIHVDIPIERVKFDTIQYLNQTLVIGFVDGGAEEDEQKEQKNGKERFF